MSRAAWTFIVAVALGGLGFALPAGGGAGERIAAAAAILAAAILGVGGVVRRWPAGWGLRAGYVLLLAYLAAWAWFQVRARDLEEGRRPAVARLETAERERVAAALTERLEADRALAVAIAGRLAGAIGPEPIGPEPPADRALFAALEKSVPAPLPAGIGIDLYDASGALRAWWGDPRGEGLPPDSIAAAVAGALVRRPAGYTLAYAGVPWVQGGERYSLVVRDVWAVESPLVAGGSDLVLPGLERAADLAFRVLPATATRGAPDARSAVRQPTPAADPAAALDPAAVVVSERFMLDRYLEESQHESRRVLAFLYLWPLLWAVGAVWHGVRSRVEEPLPGGPHWRPWLAAIGGQAVLLSVGWAFLIECRFLSLFLPADWFSPLAFAFEPFGPGGRSPGDFVTTAGLAALVCLAVYTLLPAARERAGPAWIAAAALVAIGGAALAVGPFTGTLENAMQNMSPSVFFSPTLLFSPAYLMVLLGFALLAACGITGLAIGLRILGAPSGPVWAAGAALVTAAGIAAAAWVVPQAALAGRLSTLVPLLGAGAAGAAWLAHTLAAPRRAGSSAVRLGMMVVGLAALLTVPVATYARVQAAHELLVERAERIGQASSQWLQYTMSRTADFLTANPAVSEAIAGQSRDAALLLWSQSPLRTLDFASGLYLLDGGGEVISQFALTAVDLTGRARQHAAEADSAQVSVEGSPEEGGIWWAAVPVVAADSTIGAAVAMSTDAVELREPTPGSSFILTDLLAGSDLPPDLPGYITLPAGESAPPRTLLTTVRRGGGEPVQLAMPLDPLLPGARGYAVFGFVGAIFGLLMGVAERGGDAHARSRWASRIRAESPLRSFRLQMLLAFLAVAAIPLALYAGLGYRATRLELEEATRSAAAEALGAASRMLVGDEALADGTAPVLTSRLRQIATVLQQDFILYWRGRAVVSSRPEIFASRLFADRMRGEVYADLFVVGEAIAFDSMTLAGRSFLVAYRPLIEPGAPAGYVLATPLLIREDRVRVDLQRLGEGVFLLSAFSIGFLLIVGWGLARYMARPLGALEKGTRQIAAGRLSYRLPAPVRRDEFGRLQRAFNTMAARLDEGQRALEREKSRVQAILASVGAGVVALDEAGRVRLLNERAALLLGERPADVLDRQVDELAAAGRPADGFWRAVERQVGGGMAERDLVLHRGGEERHYTLVCTGLRDGSGDERGLVVAFEDITANVQSQRVLAWGEMARQVAHEIKNPLTPMKLSLQHLEQAVDDHADGFEEMFRDNMDLVLAEIERLEKIAGNFARFAVPDPAVRVPFDASAVARDVVALYAPGEEAIAYEVEIEGQPLPLLGDPEGFRRILVNLIQNSREAVLPAGGGSVIVRLDWRREPGWAWISVLDDGIGLREQGLDRLFEPSFSTKTRGTGLGLAITRRIVEAWGGTIEYERRAGGGTAIHVRLRPSTETADR